MYIELLDSGVQGLTSWDQGVKGVRGLGWLSGSGAQGPAYEFSVGIAWHSVMHVGETCTVLESVVDSRGAFPEI